MSEQKNIDPVQARGRERLHGQRYLGADPCAVASRRARSALSKTGEPRRLPAFRAGCLPESARARFDVDGERVPH